MIKKGFEEKRSVRTETRSTDLVVVGGGMSGVCCAMTAARAGITVTLVQDRPVLGGNASSEVRLWILGATSHMGNNNRWAREGGIIDELLVENTYRNPEGNPLIFDTILLEKVSEEENINLLLNTSVYDIEKKDKSTIEEVKGFCSQNSTKYLLRAPLFCDASGDGIVAFQAGAAYRMGAEDQMEFDERFAPEVDDYGELLGHSLYFYTKDVGEPVEYVAPGFANKEAGKLPKVRNFDLQEHGCQLWWVEYGGRLDTVHQSEEIKWELWKVVYGIWDYVKNSGEYPEAETMTLEWVGMIPGKRESRRFEGDYMLTQHDIVRQRVQKDAVAFGGWAMDLHPADGVYSHESSCTQWHAKGIYQIPYRCYYSKNIENLFLAGRIISASHVAFGSSRVMATCSHGAQAVGMAAVIATEKGLSPRDIAKSPHIQFLQNELNKRGQSIPQVPLKDEDNLANIARLSSSSEWVMDGLSPDGKWKNLVHPSAQMLPLNSNQAYRLTCWVKAAHPTTLKVELRTSSKQYNHTPDVTLETKHVELVEGKQELTLAFTNAPNQDQYGFVCFGENPDVAFKTTTKRVSGLLSVFRKTNKAVSNFGRQDPPEGIGVESFEFWTPERRPGGHNFAFKIEPAIAAFGVSNVTNGVTRPTNTPNGWIPDWETDYQPTVTVSWDEEKKITEIVLMFDTDFDHPMESTLRGHPERVMPFCINKYRIFDSEGTQIYQKTDNHQTINRIEFEPPIVTSSLHIQIEQPDPGVYSALFEVLCYSDSTVL
ncbi:FAD dependent oxidoreductase [Fodinibius roseus]|uniref:FAD dependent oxidoreductase n=1 Tax=Fodinibius roseus TaxID=1194090 RepID=A0A1M5L944_9BACT|nr:FAD-dependent oxidoreductase [Fodinibius roseus]SHG61480.1 FAD dependent oxidoreductase [Fodinibius roseus]